LSVPAETVLLHDERGLSTRATAVSGSEFDFRRKRAVGTTVLDHCFTGLKRDSTGVAQVHLSTANRGVTLWVDQAFDYLMLFTGDPLPDVARRALAVEPMTCPPNAFRSGVGLIALAPGESFTGSWGITPG
jgi:aldose 1-epimerase